MVLVHWNNSPQCFLLLINTACLAETQQLPILVFGLIRLGYETTIYPTRGEHANPYTIDVVFKDYNKWLLVT
jgi:hypothetical protein